MHFSINRRCCVPCRDYNVGEGPEAVVQQVAQEEGLQLPAAFQARQLKPDTDIVAFDMVLVMDKFTAADVLREVGQQPCMRARCPSIVLPRFFNFLPGAQESCHARVHKVLLRFQTDSFQSVSVQDFSVLLLVLVGQRL
jgi:hypothetical protein